MILPRKDCFNWQIAITSLSAAGSSTLLELCKKHLKGPYRFISVGDMMRQEAESRNMTIEELAAYNLAHLEEGIDKMLDQKINILGTHNFVIAEGRLVHLLLPGAFKVYLDCPLPVRAIRRVQQTPSSLSVVKKDLMKRDSDDNTRYQKLYGPGCLWTPDQFDLVINTGEMFEMEVFQYMMASHEKWKVDATAPWSDTNIISASSCWPGFAVDVQRLSVKAKE